jgi:hypothetical protein
MFFPGRHGSREGVEPRMEHRGFSTATPAWLHTRRGAIGRTLRTASPSSADIRAMTSHPPMPSRPVRYKLRELDAHAPWTATMTTRLRKLLGTDQIGTTALHMLSNSLAPTTYSNYDSGMRQSAAFCHEENIHPLQATTQSIVRYTAWLGLQDTVAATSLQQYYSAISKFFRDHHQQPIAVGELLADARRGLEIQQERLQAADSRLPLPAPLALSLLTAAANLRTHLQLTPTSRHLIAQFRALLAVCRNCAFFCRAESGVRC